MFSCSLLALLQLYCFLYLLYLFHCSGLFYSYSLSVFSLFTSQFLFFSLFLLCINVLYASYSSVCIFNVYTFVLFFSLSLLFQCLFSILFVSSVFTMFSISFFFLYAKFNHLWYPVVWVQIAFLTVPWSVALSNHLLIAYLLMSFMIPRVGWAAIFPISSAGPHGCADISVFA